MTVYTCQNSSSCTSNEWISLHINYALMKLIEINPQSYDLESVLLYSLWRSKIPVKFPAAKTGQDQREYALVNRLFVGKHPRYGVITRTAHAPEAGNLLEPWTLVDWERGEETAGSEDGNQAAAVVPGEAKECSQSLGLTERARQINLWSYTTPSLQSHSSAPQDPNSTRSQTCRAVLWVSVLGHSASCRGAWGVSGKQEAPSMAQLSSHPCFCSRAGDTPALLCPHSPCFLRVLPLTQGDTDINFSLRVCSWSEEDRSVGSKLPRHDASRWWTPGTRPFLCLWVRSTAASQPPTQSQPGSRISK